MRTLALEMEKVKEWVTRLYAPRSHQKFGHHHSLKSEVVCVSDCPYAATMVEHSREESDIFSKEGEKGNQKPLA